MLKSIAVILSPYHCGRRSVGPGQGPYFLMNHGFISELSSLDLPFYVSEVEPVDDKDGEVAQCFELHRCVSKLVSAAKQNGAFPIILAGNCNSAVGVAAGVCASGSVKGADLGCVWFDAHDDLHTPDTITSGYGDSMAISLLAGSCFKRMLNSVPGFQPLHLKNLIHVGLRDVDDAERELVRAAELDVVWGGRHKTADFCEALSNKLQSKGLASTLVHVDLDSLDSSVGHANKFATSGGLSADELKRCLARVAARTRPQSLTIASFDPSFKGAEGIAEAAAQATKHFLQSMITQ